MKIKMQWLLVFCLNILFTGAAYANGNEHISEEESIFKELIEVLGFSTLCLLLLTFFLGRNMAKNRQKFFPWHKKLAYTAVIFALTHATLVFLFH